MNEQNVAAVIVAGGSGKRMGLGKDKLLLPLGDDCVLYYTLRAFEAADEIKEIVLVVSKSNRADIEDMLKKHRFSKIRAVVEGGKERQDSVYHGLCAVSEDISVVAVHDGARCMVTKDIIVKTIDGAINHGGAAAAVSVKDTLKQADENGMILCTVDRSKTYHVQTPQTFLKDKIIDCHQKARAEGFYATDDCALFEKYGHPVKLTEGCYTNIKITTQEDLPAAERLLAGREEEKCFLE